MRAPKNARRRPARHTPCQVGAAKKMQKSRSVFEVFVCVLEWKKHTPTPLIFVLGSALLAVPATRLS